MDTDAGLGVDPPLGSGLYALYRDREYISQRLMRSRYHAADTAALDGWHVYKYLWRQSVLVSSHSNYKPPHVA